MNFLKITFNRFIKESAYSLDFSEILVRKAEYSVDKY